MNLPSFDRMVEGYADAAAAQRRFGGRRAVMGAIGVALLVTGGTLAATGSIPIGDPAEVEPPGRPEGIEVPPEVRRHEAAVDRSTIRLRDAITPDPDGGPPWGLRTFKTVRGNECVQVGRVVDGKLGVIGFDNAFHELPALTRISRCDIKERIGPGLPEGVDVLWEGPLPPVSTDVLDEYGFSQRFGCNEERPGRGPATDRAITPCDRNRFRFVAAGLVERDVGAIETKRVPATEPTRRTPPAADRSFVYVLRGGDPAGARIGAVDDRGTVRPIVRIGRGFAVPTGHPYPAAMRVARPAVAPAEGGPGTTFALRWRVPGVARRRYDGWTYRLSGPGGPSCTVSLATSFGEPAGDRKRRPPIIESDPSGMGRIRRPEAIRRGQLVTRRIKPPGPPPYRWCPGDYRGEIRLNDKQIVGTFTFRVTAEG